MNSAILRRRVIGDSARGELVFYPQIKGDGWAHIDTGFILPEDASMAVRIGNETTKAGQECFIARQNDRITSFVLGSQTNQTQRLMIIAYDSVSSLRAWNVPMSYAEISFFLTPNYTGQGSDSIFYMKGSVKPSAGLRLFGLDRIATNALTYTGTMREFFVFGPEAALATTFYELMEFVPVATFRPCTYRGRPGMWFMEQNRFLGNAAQYGAFTPVGDPIEGNPRPIQLCQNGNFANGTTGWYVGSNTDYLRIEPGEDFARFKAAARFANIDCDYSRAGRLNHVLLIMAKVRTDAATGGINLTDYSQTNISGAASKSHIDSGWQILAGKSTVTSALATYRNYIMDKRTSDWTEVQVAWQQVFDLTAMFGAGNEPSVAEFCAMYGKDYYPYNPY